MWQQPGIGSGSPARAGRPIVGGDERAAGTSTIRARIGVLVPSANTTTEPDCYRIAPAGVTIHSARMFITGASGEALARMLDDVDTATRLVATTEPDLIAFACTSGSMIHGIAFDQDLARRISETSGSPAITTSTAVIEAFRALGVRRVAVGTPYLDSVNAGVRRFLEANGLQVVSLRGLQISDGRSLAQTPDVAFELGRSVDRPEAEAIFLSCTNLRAAETAAALEHATGKPVVTSNQAMMWAALRRCGIADGIAGFGALLHSPSAPAPPVAR